MAAVLAVLVVAASSAVVAADGTARVLRHGPRADKVVALTFDDGWGRAANERILRILVAEKVPATFFPYALAVRGDPSFWRRVARAGFPIANHSYSHPDMTRLSRHEIEWQIAASKRLVESITGVPMVRVFRPPYGRYDARVLAGAAAQGFGTVLLWDASAGDSGAGPSVAGVLRGASAGKNGSVVLLHAGPAVTPRALEAVIRGYRARGFRFVTVPELLGETAAPWPTASPPPWPTASATPWPAGTLPPEPAGGPGPTATPPPAKGGAAGAAVILHGRELPLTSLLRRPHAPSPRTSSIAS